MKHGVWFGKKIAVEAMKSGAYDYLSKPFEVDELRLVVERAFEHLALAEENVRLKRQLVSEGQFGAMIGVEPGHARAFRFGRSNRPGGSDRADSGGEWNRKGLARHGDPPAQQSRKRPVYSIEFARRFPST